MYEMKFADIGEGLHEGTVAEVFAKEGDSVKEGDNLFSVETDKMTAEIPAPVTGTIAKVLISAGQDITVGEVIFHIEEK
ncbi:biotin/lipoyl-binding protein [Mycoplasma phocoenae]|uniref:Biotin/lipoyl-binding protein n=1 Tax=Mycoplasma phocoenae TaxID=754517 RepID=A0A858U300_9MOLU|nr:biotin/lipoyl-containing protein [Mycoplasma phocoenae]QJG66850.1 biotin/lipoyl-binding protein [Mycoplasma phocoenae]